MMDHEEMDKMMDVPGAVVDMDESNLSLSKEEHWMDELMDRTSFGEWTGECGLVVGHNLP